MVKQIYQNGLTSDLLSQLVVGQALVDKLLIRMEKTIIHVVQVLVQLLQFPLES